MGLSGTNGSEHEDADHSQNDVRLKSALKMVSETPLKLNAFFCIADLIPECMIDYVKHGKYTWLCFNVCDVM